jgi:hypothetical protein
MMHRRGESRVRAVAPELSDAATWPEGLTVEEAVERAIGPLDDLYAGARAWLPVRYRYRLSQSGWLPKSEQEQLIFEAFTREEWARFPPFIKLLASGDWFARIRPWGDVSAPFRLLQPKEASQLHIIVHRDAGSLELHGPDHERLFALCYPKHIVLQLDAFPAKLTKPSGEIMSTAPDKSANAQTIALKNLLISAIEETPFPAPQDRRHGWKRKWAEAIADAINERHQRDRGNVKRTTARSVENRMHEFCLWPK